MKSAKSLHLIPIVLISLFAGLLSSCTGPPYKDQSPLNKEMENMFRIGFTNILGRYIEPLSPRFLAFTALEGIKELEPNAMVTRDQDSIILRIGGLIIDRLQQPDESDIRAWSAEVSRVLGSAKNASTSLRLADPELIYKVTFNSITSKLDKFSRYADRRESQKNREIRTGFGGVGINIEKHLTGARVTSVAPKMPAEKVGIVVGDRIVAIDGSSIRDLTLSAIIERIRGPTGKNITIIVQRNVGMEKSKLTLKRVHIVANTVFYEPRGKNAYIRVSSFNRETGMRLQESLREATLEIGTDLNGIILDIRNNPGGLLDQAVHAADLFLKSGQIISTYGRHRGSKKKFRATNKIYANNLPIAILINGTSASAAEVLAIALQDNRRAVVIGTTSFGKGSIQTVRELPNQGELILTWAQFHAPTGLSLHNVGVLPTICTSQLNSMEDAIEFSFNPALRITRHDYLVKRAAHNIEIADSNNFSDWCPWHPREGKDIDLEIAEHLISEPELYSRALDLVQ